MKRFAQSATKLSSLLIVSAFVASFLLVISAAPAAATSQATLLSPVPDNNDNTNDSTPVFVWNSTGGNGFYTIKVDNDAGLASPIIYADVAPDTGYMTYENLTTILPDGLYYWGIVSDGIMGSNPLYHPFRVDTLAPVSPTISYPTSGGYVSTTTPTIIWSAPAENSYPLKYIVEVSTSALFTSTVDNSGWITTTTHATGALTPNAMYYLRVTARDNAGNVGLLNNIQTFYVDTTKPAMLTITVPGVDNSTNISQQPIQWNAVTDNSVSYRIVISTSSTFASAVADNTQTGTVYYWPDNVVNGYYYLNVSAIDAAGNVGDNRAIKLWKDNTAPSFANVENKVIARTRDNHATAVETPMQYYFAGDNVNIEVKTTENRLTVWASFPDVCDNQNGWQISENRYLITFHILDNFADANGYAIHVVLQDNAGNQTYSDQVMSYPFTAVLNINPLMYDNTLASANTTNWKDNIKDFTHVENLQFEKMMPDLVTKIGRLKFLDNLNLCDNTTMYALMSLGDHLNIAAAEMSLDSAANALAAMNKRTELTMFNLPFTSQPGILRNGVSIVQAGDNSGSTVSGLTWDNTNKTLKFTVASWSDYKADGTAPNPPVSISVTPSSWTENNHFTINWTNPSGDNIAGAYYKIGSLPTADNDGTWKAGFNLTSILIENIGSDNTKVYVWLKDNVGNVNRENRAEVTLLKDNSAPTIPTISSSSVTEGGSTTNTSISFTWTSVGGPSTVTYYYKLEGKDSAFTSTTGTSKSYSSLATGSYTFKVYAKDNGGTGDNDNYAFTITAPPAEDNENEATTEQVTGSSTPTGGYEVTISSITAGSSANVVIQDVPITGLEIAVNSSVSNVQVTVEESATTPTGIAIAAPGETFGYLEITTQNIDDSQIDYVNISFKVEKATMGSTDMSAIALYRFTNGEWVRLPTQVISEDGTYVYYQATSPGLSVFVISTFSPVVISTSTTTTTTAPQPTTTPTAGGSAPNWLLPLIIIGGAAAIVIALVETVMHKRKVK